MPIAENIATSLTMDIRTIAASQTWELRQRVMWPHKDISYVKLADDAKGIHYGLFENDELISVISVFDADGIIQFRKFATCIERQKTGCGTRLLEHVMGQASKAGARQIWCHARKDAVAFYKRFGMAEAGDAFERDGIEYIRMSKDIMKTHVTETVRLT